MKQKGDFKSLTNGWIQNFKVKVGPWRSTHSQLLIFLILKKLRYKHDFHRKVDLIKDICSFHIRALQVSFPKVSTDGCILVSLYHMALGENKQSIKCICKYC